MDRLAWVGALLTVFAVLVAGCRDDEYPRCGAFEFEPLKLVDADADPLDCGAQRLDLELNDTGALDCALEALADGQAFRLELEREPRGDVEDIQAELFGDEDGLAMLWQNLKADLNGTIESKVIQLDVERIVGCRNFEDAGDRYTCFDAAIEAAKLVDECASRDWESR